MYRILLLSVLFLYTSTDNPLSGQFPVPASVIEGMQFRDIGPSRGGRVTAVDGIASQPFTFYMGTTGGGVWKSTTGGQTWENVSDGYFAVGSIGSIDVADSDPDLIFVGTGSAAIRGNVSTGRGMYRSRDGARTWELVGLEDAGQIARVRVHPTNPNIVYAAATGHPFGRNDERGVFRSTDGGDTWDNILFLSDSVGAIDLSMDASDPNVLYAGMWRGERKPWTMISGANEGGVFKTVDGGDTWEKLVNGLPAGPTGKIGIAVSPANSNRVWAIIEAMPEEIGLYRSDDAGASWEKISTNQGILSRPWYFYYVWPHPHDEDVVWVGNSGFYKSTNGGESFSRVAMPHSDHHAMWINPDQPDIILQGNDGGATVSFDGGNMWSIQLNQPTAEMYSVTVDNQFPYRVYGSQQDNSTLSLPNLVPGTGITFQHWLSHGGCETGPVAVRPDNPDVAYSGCFGGRLARYDDNTQQFRQIRDYPQEQGGMPESKLRYRIQWNAPIVISPHDPNVLYHGSQYVHRTTNEGQSWDVISPDLTANDVDRFGMAGGPITHDITGVETWSSLLALAESPFAPGEIWTGSNDGKVFLTRDNGANWADVTPRDLPFPSTVNRLELSPHRPGTAFIAAYRYRLDDWAPYIYKTMDYGETWERIADGTRGIPADYPTRVVREDPDRMGLLYAGTEFGLFMSLDDGATWQPLQQNLPRTPVTDLVVHEKDLVVATQGRGFWILDDLSPLHQVSADVISADHHLFQPRPAYRTNAVGQVGHWDRDRIYGGTLPRSWKGQNPPAGVIVYYHLAARADSAAIDIFEENGTHVRTFARIPRTAGGHRFNWDLRYPGPQGGGMQGPKAVPGNYVVRLSVDGWQAERTVEVRKDPRLTDVTVLDLQDQFDLLVTVRENLDSLESARRRVVLLKQEVDSALATLSAGGRRSVDSLATRVLSEANAVEGLLVQTRPGRWSNEPKIRANLRWVAGAAQTQRGISFDSRPTDQLWERQRDLAVELQTALVRLDRLIEGDAQRLRARLRNVS